MDDHRHAPDNAFDQTDQQLLIFPVSDEELEKAAGGGRRPILVRASRRSAFLSNLSEGCAWSRLKLRLQQQLRQLRDIRRNRAHLIAGEQLGLRAFSLQKPGTLPGALLSNRYASKFSGSRKGRPGRRRQSQF
jgi:hypothetical protein